MPGTMIVLGLGLALAGCASSGPARLTERQRAYLGEAAEPSEIIANEIAFARAARENGQWTAFREFAGEGAIIHLIQGPVPASAWLARQANPRVPVQWTPTALWSSCDGHTTVAYGTSRNADGTWGYYATIWERQRDRSYRWVYRLGGSDNALTEPEARRAEPPQEEDGVILVRAFADIRAEVAQCRLQSLPARPAVTMPEGTRGEIRQSRDGTLVWRWEQQETGMRRLVVDFLQDGAWTEAFALAVSPADQVVQ